MNETNSSPEPAVDSQTQDISSKRLRRLKRFGVLIGVILIFTVALVIGAEYYTSRAQFCGTCHIMQPYYQGWTRDVHASVESYAACVDCHYAPGEQHTIKAKLRGLSQLASYCTGRSGAARPRAHVQDASCLTGNCHGNRRYMQTEQTIGSAVFEHAKHLDPKSAVIFVKKKQLAAMRSRLAKQLSSEQLASIEVIAKAMTQEDLRDARLTQWLGEHQLSAWGHEIITYAQLLHTEARIDQLGHLQCASCHQYDPTIKKHFDVDYATCYICHFINQPFNQGTGRCLSCHESPAIRVPIHAGAVTGTKGVAADGTGKVVVDHATIVANKVDCISCHADLLRGSGEVTRRDCQTCHDQDRYLQKFDQLTIEVVGDYHRVHTANQHARCNDCHQLIEHKLIPMPEPSDVDGLLQPVHSQCQHCHPDPHQEQAEILLGRGGSLPGKPNPMIGAGMNCRGCHTEPGPDPGCRVAVENARQACRGCHSSDYQELFSLWLKTIKDRLAEAQQLLDKVEKRIKKATSSPEDWNEFNRLLVQARKNIQLVMSANGIHNKDYAMMLLDKTIEDLNGLLKKLPQ